MTRDVTFGNFDEIDENKVGGSSLFDDGTYKFSIEDLELIPTKKGDGQMIKAVFKGQSGAAKGSVMFHNFVVQHPSEQTTKIHLQEVKRMMIACGIEASGAVKLSAIMKCKGKGPIWIRTKTESQEGYADKSGVERILHDYDPQSEAQESLPVEVSADDDAEENPLSFVRVVSADWEELEDIANSAKEGDALWEILEAYPEDGATEDDLNSARKSFCEALGLEPPASRRERKAKVEDDTVEAPTRRRRRSSRKAWGDD